MEDKRKTKEQLIKELTAMRQRVAILEKQKSNPSHLAGFKMDITEAKLAEKALRESEARFRSLFELPLIGIAITSPEKGWIEVNNQICSMMGYSREELLHTTWSELTHPEDLVADVEQFNHVLAGHIDSYSMDKRFIRKNGEVLWASIAVGCVRDFGGMVKYIIALGLDITERKRAEEELRKASLYARSLIEASLDPLVTISSDGKIMDVNQATEQVTGITRNRLIGSDFSDYFSEPDKAKAGYQRVFQDGFIQDYALEIRHKDGHLTPVLYNSSVYRDDAGQVIGVFAAARDITARKQTEERLRLQITALEATANAIIITDREGMIQWTNSAFTALTGYAFAEVVGKNPRELVKSGKQDQAFYKDLWDMILAGKVWRGQIINRCKDGSLYTEEMTITPLQGERGEISHFIAIKQDITERKRIEKEITNLQEHLHQVEKLEAIGSLAGGIAHDFNNVLTIIKGYSQFALNDLDERDPLAENIREILAAANRASDLTHQLLAFSRKQILEPRVLDPNIVIQGMEKMLRRMIGEDINLLIHAEEDLGRIKADPGQIEQVILNLAVNARDAMPSGGELILETDKVYLDEEYAKNHISVKPGHYIRLSVSDTGIGMEPKIKDHIFEPFFTTKEKGRGTGLGLSTVYGIVKQSGGNIWVYSEVGKGTTFKIYLPQVDEPAEDLEEKRYPEAIPCGSETVLVVEDEDKVQKLAVQILRKQGYKVLEAHNGGEALLVCEQHQGPLHLILTDVVMPMMSGPEFIERMRQIRQDFKVLYMSGYTDEAVVHHGIRRGDMEFIQKPFSNEMLARKVRDVLDKVR